MSSSRFTKQFEIRDPVFDGVTLDADRTSDTFSIQGASQITLFCALTLPASSDLSALLLYVDTQPEEDNTNFYTETEEEVLDNVVTVNVETCRQYKFEWSSDNTTHYFTLQVPVVGENCRLRLDETGDDASATFTCRVIKSVQ